MNDPVTRPGVGRLAGFLAELRRRRVIRALFGWVVVSFATLQVAEPLMHALDLKDWVLKVVVAVLAAGFPVAAMLSWFFDLGPSGVTRTPDAAPPEGGASAPARRGALVGLVLVAALVGAGLAVVAMRAVDAGPPAPPSVAVLPFADMSPQHDQEYLSDGIAEEILNALAQVEGLKVIGRTSSFSFKGRNEDLRVIGQRLGARALLEGSVRKDGARIRITAQLVRAADGSHLWSRTFDRELVDVFAVQSEIAQGVVEALRARLVPGPAVAPAERRVTIPEAYRRVLLGRDWCRRGEPRRTVGVLEGAVALDPGYAPGWAWLSVAVAGAGGADDTPERMAASFARARAAADSAVSLDPELAEAYLARSNITFWYGLDLAATGPDVDRALALSPGSAWANFARGAVLLAAGLPREALGVLRKAADLDPLDVGVWSWTLTALGAMGDVAGAREASDRQRQVALDAAWNVSGLILLLEGKTDAALAAFEREPDEAVRLWGLALARHRLGHPAAAREALDAFERRYGATQAVAIAEIHAQWGEIDAAFEWLERAYLRRNRDLILAKVNPFLGPLRGDPRFRALLAKMNVPDG